MRAVHRIFLVSILAILLISGCTGEDRNKPSAGRAPDFALKDLKGNTLHLKDLRGKVVLLNFFATWCAPCRQEIPDFVRIYERFKDKGLEIVGISLDMEGATLLNPFVRHYGITYPVVLGTREVVVDYGGIKGIPTSFLVDRNGVVTEHFVGLRPWRVLEKSVMELLQKKA
jgi:cytochrome c biogenesis protein CcmG/thiol:disulfide interchange protein DsbE